MNTGRAQGMAAILLAVTRRPSLWPTAARAGLELRRRNWWRQAPFLPLPDKRWLQFRLVTAYGGEGRGPIAPADLITWLEWRRRWPG